MLSATLATLRNNTIISVPTRLKESLEKNKKTLDIFRDLKEKEKLGKHKDKDGNLVYPDAKEDLLTHYFASQTMSGKSGVAMPISLALGLIKEIGDSQRVPYFNPSQGYFEESTGFSVDDFNMWPEMSKTLIFFLFFIGGSAGSTTGGMKIIRSILVIKYLAPPSRIILNGQSNIFSAVGEI